MDKKFVTPETENETVTNPAPDAADESAGEAGDSMPTVERAKVGAIGDSLIEDMSEVQQHAIDQEAQQQADKIAEHTGEGAPTDKNGDTFDPALHKVDRDGNPTLTKKNNLILKPGRKPGAVKSGASVVGVNGSAQVDKGHAQIVQARATGVASANMLISLGRAIGGEEWQPIKNAEYKIDEKLNLENAFADYFEATGKTDIPPGMALTIAVGAYALPRFTMPATQKRAGKVKQWFVKLLADRKLKKHGMKAQPVEKSEMEA